MFKQIIQTMAVALAFALPCAASIGVSSPTNNSTVSSPTKFVANASSSAPITAWAVYVDNNLATTASGSSLNTSVNMGGGKHFVVVQAWDSRGAVQKAALTLNVSGSGPSPSPSGTAFYNIDEMSGWQNCGACAGAGGHGPTVPYSMTQYRSSPSMDGKSAQFWIGGRTPYSSAIWWKQLGARPGSANFTYDLYFYLDNPGAAQALEFDLNQSVNGRKYIFGTQCNSRGDGQWDVWNAPAGRWVPTGIGCPAPSAYKWHHLTIDARRVGGQTNFIAITLDGRKSYVNRYYNTNGSGVQELNVAVQLDTNNASTNYSIWTDKISLYYH